jgi:hypothetical protein
MSDPIVQPAGAPSRKRSFYHPLSGLAILGIDFAFWGLGWELGPVTMAVAVVASAVSSYAVVSRVQTRLGGDDPKRARLKALIGATAAGVPFAIGGTVLGGLILVLSGLKTVPILNRRS